MIHLVNIKTNEIVIDFQLIYDTDSVLHLDFYADGLRKESQLLFQKETMFQKIHFGFLICSQELYEEYEEAFNYLMGKWEFLNTVSKNMVSTIRNVHLSCLRVEKNAKNDKFNMEEYKMLYEFVTDMMAYKRFSDRCESLFEQVRDVKVPSYLMRFLQHISRLDIHSNEEMEKFIEKYGFLHDFYIKKTRLETLDGVKEYVQKNNFAQATYQRKNKKTSLNQLELLYKRVSWYEELRHYYQLRALRNFRKWIEYLNLDIHETTTNTLFEKGGI